MAQRQPAAALAVLAGILGQFHNRPSPRYAWPVLVAGIRACTAAAAQGQALAPRAGELLGRVRAEAGQLGADGPAQHAHQLTFAAEIIRARQDLGGATPEDHAGAGRAARGAWGA